MSFRFFIIALCVFCCPAWLFARLEFFTIFPNTIDDANLEYIEIRNTGCESVSLSGMILEDASKKQFIFSSGTVIESHNTMRVSRPTSKMILNNTDETLFLKNPDGSLIDQFSYTTSAKGVIIIDISVVDTECSSAPIVPPPSVISGSIVSGEFPISPPADAVLEPSDGLGDWIADISPHTDPASISGSLHNSGSTDTGISTTQTPPGTGDIIFPDIFPTLQSPSNAVFSGGFFDCTSQSPCRINPTFEPIFTTGFVSKNYVCEVITQTGSQNTCNPNTLYFPTDGYLIFRLTSKVDPSQSRTVRWDVKFLFAPLTPKDIDSIPTTPPTLSPASLSGMSPTVSTSSGGSIDSDISFPEIILTLQNYTNTTYRDDIFTCTTTPCRLNFTLEPIFTGSFLASDFSCEITLLESYSTSCNPPQWYLTRSGSLEIVLIHKKTGKKKIGTYDILAPLPDIPAKPTTPPPPTPPIDTILPVAIMQIDGKWKEYYKQTGDYEMNCYTDTCSLNFTAEQSYDPGGGSVRFLWIYDWRETSDSRDPGAKKFTHGDHTIILRVIDTAGNMSEIRYLVHVLGKPEKSEKPAKVSKNPEEKNKKRVEALIASLDKKLDTIESKTDEKIGKARKKQQKKLKIQFFVPPEVVLQGKNTHEIRSDTYRCLATKKTCDMNFTLTGTLKNYRYEWSYDDGLVFVGKNPKAHRFTLGTHRVILSVYEKSGTQAIWSKELQIEAQKKPKHVKKSKKKQKKKKQKKKSVSKPKKPPPDTPPASNQRESAGMIGSLLFLIGMSFPVFVKKFSSFSLQNRKKG